MRESTNAGVNRREFLIQSGLAAGAVAGGLLGTGCATTPPATTQAAKREYRGVYLAYDGKDEAIASKPSQWAISQLEQSLKARNIRVWKADSLRDINNAWDEDLRILVHRVPTDREMLPESVAAGINQTSGRSDLHINANDIRGFVYGITDAADVVSLSENPLQTLAQSEYQSESPANTVRSVMRMFSTNVEDKGWFNDRDFWRDYLTMLASNRFNRFNLSLGLGYDFATGLTDTYFYFAYPFLVSVPGYNVRATNLSSAERDRNLEMLRFISDETVARGLEFQLGVWTHAYIWQNSPNANHVIEGLTADKHAEYSRDALTLVLKECPSISGVTLRIHGESGVTEGSYDFWKTVFSGAAGAGRSMRLDLHAKGIDQPMIDNAVATGLPVTVSPKYWAEHMGLPYHQAAIRPTELPTRAHGSSDLMALSTGSRSFTRYGYGDLLTEDRKFSIVHRMWPGTQRVLLWGDPVFAAAYSRSSSFCGTNGCELMEPLSFKGRKGSGVPGGRDGYGDTTLRAPGGDFEKYQYYYRVWGRMLFNPQTPPQVMNRWLAHEYGPEVAPSVEQAIATSSRILPLFTTAHTPAAANNNYWPEMYVNQSIVNGARREPYTEEPNPSRFGTVSPLDPQMFTRIEDYSQMLLDQKSSGKYNSAEVAQALEDLANSALKSLAAAHAKAQERSQTATFRRMAIDVTVAAGLGRFFSHKIRASALWAIYDRGGHSRDALEAALKEYRAARDAWLQVVEQTRGVYANDVSYGSGWFQRGHWSDRLSAIEADIAAMEAQLAGATPQPTSPYLLLAATRAPQRPEFAAEHTPQPRFTRGSAMNLLLKSSGSGSIASVQCYYRRTHQAEAWTAIPMQPSAGGWSGNISRPTTESNFPIQYYFELTDSSGRSTLYPGFNSTWSDQPYFVTRPTLVAAR